MWPASLPLASTPRGLPGALEHAERWSATNRGTAHRDRPSAASEKGEHSRLLLSSRDPEVHEREAAERTALSTGRLSSNCAMHRFSKPRSTWKALQPGSIGKPVRTCRKRSRRYSDLSARVPICELPRWCRTTNQGLRGHRAGDVSQEQAAAESRRSSAGCGGEAAGEA